MHVNKFITLRAAKKRSAKSNFEILCALHTFKHTCKKEKKENLFC